jgi:colanic acid/amylovoran biosynthesis glycosyltransferase
MFAYAAKLLCASHELAELLVKFGAPEEKVIVHQLGIDVRTFIPPAPGLRRGTGEILMVGRLVEKKGMEYGLRAFAQVRSRFPQARITIIGEGPLQSALERLVKELHLNDCVSFLGAQTPEQVRARMQIADIMLTPSVVAASGDRESGVIVLKEAGAMALPTLATLHGGIPEIVEQNESGFLVAERDVDALAQHLAILLAEPELREKMGQTARRLIESRYDTITQNARLEEHLVAASHSVSGKSHPTGVQNLA